MPQARPSVSSRVCRSEKAAAVSRTARRQSPGPRGRPPGPRSDFIGARACPPAGRGGDAGGFAATYGDADGGPAIGMNTGAAVATGAAATGARDARRACGGGRFRGIGIESGPMVKSGSAVTLPIASTEVTSVAGASCADSMSAERNSSAVWYRSSGGFASARSRICSHHTGSSARTCRSGVGASLSCFCAIAAAVSALNGRWPVSIR